MENQTKHIPNITKAYNQTEARAGSCYRHCHGTQWGAKPRPLLCLAGGCPEAKGKPKKISKQI